MERRAFLQLLFGGLVVAGCQRQAAAKRRLERIGLQLYTVRSLMKKSVPETLRLVAEVGYDEVEFAGYFNHTPEEIRQMLDEVGLDAPGAHLPFEAFEERLDEVFGAASTIGHRYLILPWMAPETRQTLDDYRRWAEWMNRTGQVCKEAGFQFGYHNHDFELTPIEGQRPFDILLQETDPSLVAMEMDLYWTVYGGGDPLEYFRRYPGRFQLCHVKDMTADRKMVDVGQGSIDFARIFAHAREAGLRHFFVEHDKPEDPTQSIRNSYTYLANLTF